MLKQIHIYDMDGVLVDSTHRFRTLPNGKIDLQYWIDNEYKAYHDKLLPLAEQYKEQLQKKDTYVIIATARVLNKPDIKFIHDKLGIPNHIISRNGRYDNRRGAQLKLSGLKKLLNLRQFAKIKGRHFWEDNPDYLYPVCEGINAIPHFIPSEQGV